MDYPDTIVKVSASVSHASLAYNLKSYVDIIPGSKSFEMKQVTSFVEAGN